MPVDLSAWAVGDAEPAASIAQIAIFTCDRPRALARALTGYAAHGFSPATNDRSLAIFDDSRTSDGVLENQRLAAAVSVEHGIPIWYCGRRERTQFADALSDAGIPPDIARFALFGDALPGGTVGANRNAFVLSRAPGLYFCVDDDTECRMLRGDAAAGLSLTRFNLHTVSAVEPYELTVFPDRSSLLETCALEWRSPLHFHEEFLGRDVRACVWQRLQAGLPVDVSRDRPRFLTGERPPDARVVATLNGFFGDSGWHSPVHYLWLDGGSFATLVRSDDAYRLARTSRAVVRSVPRATVTDCSSNLMAGFTGLDTRALVPPFPPCGRGEDAVFGLLLTLCRPDACFAHLPCTLFHDPLEPRQFAPDALLRGVIGVDLCTVLSSYLSALSAEQLPEAADERMRAIGEALERLGEMPPAAASTVIRRDVMKAVHRRIAVLERRLGPIGSDPPLWAVDARNVLETLTVAARRANYHVPVECAIDGDSGAMARTQSHLGRLGGLLRWWPDMLTTSRELAQDGKQMATLIDPAQVGGGHH